MVVSFPPIILIGILLSIGSDSSLSGSFLLGRSDNGVFIMSGMSLYYPKIVFGGFSSPFFSPPSPSLFSAIFFATRYTSSILVPNNCNTKIPNLYFFICLIHVRYQNTETDLY